MMWKDMVGATIGVLALAAPLLAAAVTMGATDQGLQVYPEGTTPPDVRLGELRTLDSKFPFTPVSTPEEWAERAAALRRRVRVANGLWPLPTRTPLRPVLHGKMDRPDYSVERVYFESLPGHFVTGNLYRPKGSPGGRRCAVLSPHGHTGSDADRRNGGRVHDHGPAGVRAEIATGAERFEVGGRHFLQARGVQLARMGCVVFQYDMVGYADSVQLAHKGLGVRPHMSTPERWGFSSPRPSCASSPSWACRPGTRSAPWTSSSRCPTWTPSGWRWRATAAGPRRCSCWRPSTIGRGFSFRR